MSLKYWEVLNKASEDDIVKIFLDDVKLEKVIGHSLHDGLKEHDACKVLRYAFAHGNDMEISKIIISLIKWMQSHHEMRKHTAENTTV